MNEDGLQNRLSRFNSGRRLQHNPNHTNDLGAQSQPPVTTEPLEPGGKPGGGETHRFSRRGRLIITLCSLAWLLGGTAYALSLGDHTSKTIRDYLVWIATGERPGHGGGD